MTTNSNNNEDKIVSPETLKQNTLEKDYLKLKNYFKFTLGTSIFALIVAIVVSLEIAWFFSRESMANFQQTVKLQNLENSTTVMSQKLIMLENFLTQKNQQQNFLSYQIDSLKNQILELKNQNITENIEIYQIEKALEQAKIAFQLWQDVPTTLNLLNYALAKLDKLNDYNYWPLQQKLSQVILTLKSLPDFSTTNLLIRISAIKQKSLELPLIFSQFALSPAETIEAGPKTPAWKIKLKEALSQLKGLIIIRHHKEPFEPLLPPAQESMLRQSLSQLFNQAAWAVLHQNPDVYNFSLNNALHLMHQYYPQEAKDVLTIENEILKLMKINIKPNQPDLNELITLMNSIKNKQKKL